MAIAAPLVNKTSRNLLRALFIDGSFDHVPSAVEYLSAPERTVVPTTPPETRTSPLVSFTMPNPDRALLSEPVLAHVPVLAE
jgi:hypothetical protein